MKAIVIDKPGKVSIIELDIPQPGPGEVLLRIRYVGFCGSDLSTYLGKNPLVSYPRIPGHEISGVIAGLGEEVPDGFAVDSAVTVLPYTSCGTCPSCRRGRSYACRENQTLGVQREGAMQEYITIPWQKILLAPKLNELDLVIVEPLTVGFHAIQRGRVEKSDVVMVLGCGMIGAGAIAAAIQQGARVIAVDIDNSKLELARALGVQHTIHSKEKDIHQELDRLTRGDGPDVVVEAAGNPLTYRLAVDEVAFTGRVVCIGYAGSEVSFATRAFVQKEIDIMGSRNAAPEDFRAVISYLEQGTFPLDKMITEKIRPEEASRVLSQWAGNPWKVMKLIIEFKP